MRCKVGDLVVVINAYYPENLGRFGKIDRPYEGAKKNYWVVIPKTTFRGIGWLGEINETSTGTCFEDYKLLPVNPEDLKEEETASKELELSK